MHDVSSEGEGEPKVKVNRRQARVESILKFKNKVIDFRLVKRKIKFILSRLKVVEYVQDHMQYCLVFVVYECSRDASFL